MHQRGQLSYSVQFVSEANPLPTCVFFPIAVSLLFEPLTSLPRLEHYSTPCITLRIR